MSIEGSRGKWQVRYRDEIGRQRKRTFARKADAQRFLWAREAEAQRVQDGLKLAGLPEARQVAEAAREAIGAHDAALWAELMDETGGFDPTGSYVYLLWSRKGDAVPLYVGSSTNVLSRLGKHLGVGAKRAQVGWVSLVRCASEDEMLEYALIRKFRPPWNALIPIYARITPDAPEFRSPCAPDVPEVAPDAGQPRSRPQRYR